MEIKGLKKAVGEYKKYNKDYASPEYAYLMYDKETGELWTDYFYDLGHNSFKQYHDESVINIGFLMNEREIEINMKNVKEFIDNNF